MWQDITGKTGSAVYNQSIGTVSKGSTVCVTDASGNVLAAVSPAADNFLPQTERQPNHNLTATKR